MQYADPAPPDLDANYILGHSDVERERLRRQGEFMASLTERYLVDAGLRPGMRVLDVGSGFGDVALLAARVVGSDGAVVGVEREISAVTQAEQRVRELGVTNVSFRAGDLRDIDPGAVFDAVIGRFVLMYLADPATAIRSTTRHLREGGIVAFQEWHAADPFSSEPSLPLWSRTGEVLVEAFRRAGTNLHAGLQLRRAFIAAGLPSPRLRAERLAGGGPDYDGYGFLAGLINSVMPMIERYGIATASDIEPDSLEQRLRTEAVSADATVALPTIVSAWATI
jgi:SAM-dependent methyltransferase